MTYQVVIKGLTGKTAHYREPVSQHVSFEGAQRKVRAINRSIERREHPLCRAWNESPSYWAFMFKDDEDTVDELMETSP